MSKKNTVMIMVFSLFCGAFTTLQAQNMEGVVKQSKQVQIEGTKLKARESHELKKTREITLLEDRDQSYMTTKIYELKHMKASDLTPFVEGAVKRADKNSIVGNLVYKKGDKNFLSVSMPNFMVPYVDDMVKKLDRPGVKDSSNSVIAGTGIHHFYYSPNYRSTDEMLKVLFARFTNGDTIVYRGAGSNFFYWKGSQNDGRTLGNWLKAMDRPLPQMSVRIKLYQISVSDLKELGLDWVALKNGPGAELFGAGLDIIKNQSFTDLSNMMDFSSLSSFTNPGFFIAPNIDMTFLRLLAQKGKAKIATSAYLTVVNDQNYNVDRHNNYTWSPMFENSRYRISFNPVFQTITKSNDQYQEVKIVSRQPSLRFFLSAPVICFDNAAMSNQAAIMNFNWNIAIENSPSESTHNGDLVQDNFYFSSYTKLRANSEKLIATYIKRHKVRQDNGVPFLGDLPVLKYVFGATTNSWKDYRYYVTIEAKPADPMDCTWSEWAGKLVKAEDMLDSPIPAQKCQLRQEWAPAEDILPEHKNLNK